MDGIINWYIQQRMVTIKYKSKQEQARILKKDRESFSQLLKSVQIHNAHDPMNIEEDDYELGLHNPYS